MDTLEIDLSDLTEDGDIIDLEDGRKLRLRIESDPDASVNDYEGDGRVEWTRNNYYGAVRPSDFTGRARIMDRDHYSTLWWEPPTPEMVGCVWTEQQLREEESRIRLLLQDGFCVVTLELLDGKDAYGRPIVTEAQSLGAIDSLDNGKLAEVLSDLLAEMDLA
jgi:hypothetical protein